MAAAITCAKARPLEATTISGTGFTATTDYILTVTTPDGSIQTKRVTSDGSGAFSVPYVPQLDGSTTIDARPAVEHKGTTTAAATLTHKTK